MVLSATYILTKFSLKKNKFSNSQMLKRMFKLKAQVFS